MAIRKANECNLALMHVVQLREIESLRCLADSTNKSRRNNHAATKSEGELLDQMMEQANCPIGNSLCGTNPSSHAT